jgi:hypothetical protein
MAMYEKLSTFASDFVATGMEDKRGAIRRKLATINKYDNYYACKS